MRRHWVSAEILGWDNSFELNIRQWEACLWTYAGIQCISVFIVTSLLWNPWLWPLLRPCDPQWWVQHLLANWTWAREFPPQQPRLQISDEELLWPHVHHERSGHSWLISHGRWSSSHHQPRVQSSTVDKVKPLTRKDIFIDNLCHTDIRIVMWGRH